MPTVKINNIDMYYQQKGLGEPLILVSGLGSNHKAWETLVDTLSQRYTLIMPDNRGSGRTSQPKEHYTIEQMADDIAELMQSLNIASAHFVGHSMGGCIVQQLVLKYPAKVKSAILAGTTAKCFATLSMVNHTTINLMNAGTSIKLIIENIIPWLYASHFLENEKNVQTEIKRNLDEPDIQTYEGFVGQVMALETFDVSMQLQNIKCPTLIIAGSEDALIILKHQQFLQDHIPHAKLAVVEECGHMFQREKPLEFTNLISSFLDSVG